MYLARFKNLANMKKKLVWSLLAVLALTLTFCDRSDDIGPAKKRDYAEQYTKDSTDIETFLKTHTYTVINHPGFSDDQDVTFTEVPAGTAGVIWDELGTNLLSRTVHTYRDEDETIPYTLYYLKLRQGGGQNNDRPKPTNTDKVLAAYTGKYMFHLETTDEDTGEVIDSLKTYEFESQAFPQTQFDLQQVIRGWSEIFPLFNAGDPNQVEGEPTLYTDFGAGVMFIPSGLGYYNQALGSIPAYSPLIFTFKLLAVTHVDTDNDGIPDYLEDRDGDGYMYIILNDEGTGEMRPDDIDGDGAPNYLDLDDDGDNVLTETEFLSDPNDNDSEPLTWETVPDCSGNTTDPNRLRRFYNPACTGQEP